jgi:uncharacterized protein (TIGR02996 family)
MELEWGEATATAVQLLLERANGRRSARTLSVEHAREVAEAALAADVGYAHRVAGEGDATELTTLVLAVVQGTSVVLGAATVRAHSPLPDRAWGELGPWDRYSGAANIARCQVWASRPKADRVAVPLTAPPTVATAGELARRIAQTPEDDGLRLVLADVLSEAGDERGEFIAAQIELERPDLPAAHKAQLESRVRDLLATHETQWLGVTDEQQPIAQSIQARWRRGFVENVRITDDRVLLRGRAFFEEQPVTSLTFLSLRHLEMARFAAFPWLGRLKHLSIDLSGLAMSSRELAASRQLGGESLEVLLQSRHLRNLTGLSLNRQQLGDTGGLLLAAKANAAFPRLRTLSLVDCGLGSLAVTAFGEAKWVAALTALDLSFNITGPDGLAGLLAHTRPLALEALRYDSARLDDGGAMALANNQRMAQLRRLSLTHNRIGSVGARALLESQALAELVELDLRGNPLGRRETAAWQARFRR